MAHRSPPPPPSHRYHPGRPLLGPPNGLHPSLSNGGVDRAPPMNGGPSSSFPRANSFSSAPGMPSPSPYPPNPAPPPLSVGGAAGPPQQGPSVLQILAIGQERNHAADSMAHHPRIESLVKLGKESEATWLQIGATAESLGDLDRAVASYESALRHNAYSVVALSQIAAICRSKEEFKKAAEYFGRVVGIAPESGDVWGALGHCYLMIDDLKKAYSSYQQALYYMPNPQEPKLWYGIGILYDRYGSLEHAEEAFSSVIRMDPSFEKANEIFFRLGIIYKQQRKSAQSLECFRYILQNPPRPLTEIDIWFQIGHVYEQQKDFIAAKESYERVLTENPAHAKVLQQLGGLYHRSRAPFYNPEASVTILTKSLESDANDPFSWYLLGRAYMTTNNFGKAYEAYQQAVYRDGKNPAFWCSIGVLYYNINQFHDALDAYSRAIRIQPYLAEVWFNLGALYESCNDQMTDAIDAYQRTLSLDPSNTIVTTRLRELREHQTNGAPLSAPPTPKDISPSSLSWNYATNAGGAPAYLAQSGLGPELSPAVSRPGALSPPNGHGFDGPPAPLGRSDSSNSYRGSDERRRSSATHQQQSPTASMNHSPRSSTHRLSGPSQTSLPQIKSLYEMRGSPTIPPTSELQRLRSPPSPRTRHSDLGPDHNYPPQLNYRQPPPPQLLQPYARGGLPPVESAERGNGMEWERTGRMGSSNGRGSATSQRPGSSQSRGEFAPSSFAHERHAPSPSSSRPSILDERDPRDPRGGPLSPYPSPAYGYGGHYPPQPSYEPPRRFDPRDREQAEEERRRGGSMAPMRGENSPRPASGVAPPEASGSGKEREVSRSPATVPAGKSNVTITGAATKSRKKDSGETVTGKRDRKASSTSSKSKDEAPAKKPRTSNGTPRPAVVEPPSTNSSPADSPTPVPPQIPSRTVDEDYDEGVDALMELATTASSHEPSPPIPPTIDSANLPPLPPVETPEAKLEEGPKLEEGEKEDVNPRKRGLGSPEEDESNKRSKSVVEADVVEEVVVQVVVKDAPVVVKEEATVEEQEDGEVPETVPTAVEVA